MLNEMAQAVHEIAVSKGWWHDKNGEPRDPTDTEFLLARIALMHSELSEALEDVRDGVDLTALFVDMPEYPNLTRSQSTLVESLVREVFNPAFPEHIGRKPEGFPIEMADVIIRVLDTCAALGIDIDEALSRKVEYNRTRPYRHGGKLA